MRALEEEPTEADRAAADALAKTTIVDAHVTQAIAAKGYARYAELLRPHMTQHLQAIHQGEGDGYRVLAVDRTGSVRTTARGPMAASDLFDELLRNNPTWLKVFR